MIKANELRLGNKVNSRSKRGYENPGVVTVSGIDSRGINHWSDMGASGEHPFEESSGIPLTEEWLRKLGFEKMLDSADPDYGPIEWTKEYEVSYQKSPAYIVLWPNEGGGNGSFLLDNYSSAPLHFVHQLQNLYFALTGEELTIKEPA